MSTIIKTILRVWRELFPKYKYKVYVGGISVYYDDNIKDAISCYRKHCSFCLASRYGGTILLIRKRRGFNTASETIKKLVVREGYENDSINRNFPFKG